MTQIRPSLPVIYLLDGSVAVTGAFVCAKNIAKALDGSAKVVLVLPGHSTIGAEDIESFDSVRRLPIRPLRRSAGAVIVYLPFLLLSSIQLRWSMWRDGATALLVNDFYHMQGVGCRLLGFQGKIITWVRISPAAFGGSMSRIWLNLSALASEKLMVVSKYIQELIPANIATELLYDALEKLPAPPAQGAEATRFIYVGNYIPGKGQDHALEAFGKIATASPRVSLHFYGGDMGLPRNQAYRDWLHAQASRMGLSNRVFLNGFERAATRLFDGAIAALNFSDSESFSMTVLEAQGSGVAVIATRSGGPAEIIADGRTGLLVSVGSVDEMASAMLSLAADVCRAQEMGNAARIAIRERFSIEKFNLAVMELVGIQIRSTR